MSRNPFVVPHSKLPETLAVFPLPGAIVMPGSDLPLNIFEPRYLNMVTDALATHRMIGMIQPNPSQSDGSTLYKTGCGGRITQYRETTDGRIELVLTGVCRFDLGPELKTTRGYRLVVPDWSRFGADYEDPPAKLDERHKSLIEDVKRYFESNNLDVNWPILERLSTIKLVDSLTMALPLSHQDKQAILETRDATDRAELFLTLLDRAPGEDGSNLRH